MIRRTTTATTATARWLLLCALALGVVAMHHVGAAKTDQAHGGHAIQEIVVTPVAMSLTPVLPMADPAPAGGHDEGHSALHLCWAILLGFAIIVLFLRLGSAIHDAGSGLTAQLLSARFARAPPPAGSGREILHRACVLRI